MSVMTPCPRTLGLRHLLLRLRPLHRALRAAADLRDAVTERLHHAGAIPEAITRGHVDAILDDLDRLTGHGAMSAGPATLSHDELAAERTLRDEAAAAGACLPLDALGDALGLDEFERETLVLCAASELDSGLERVFGFLHDDVRRANPSIELACALTAPSLAERIARRAALGPWGRLRRLGLVTVAPGASGLRGELHLAPAALEALLGTPVDHVLIFRDPAEVSFDPPAAFPAASRGEDDLVQRAAAALAEQRIDVIAIWGRPRAARDVVARIAAHVGARAPRYSADDVDPRSTVASRSGAHVGACERHYPVEGIDPQSADARNAAHVGARERNYLVEGIDPQSADARMSAHVGARERHNPVEGVDPQSAAARMSAHVGARARRYPVEGVDPPSAAAAAAALGTLLWIDLDALGAEPPQHLLDVCCHTRVPLLLTGTHAWRPPELVAARRFVELPTSELDHAARRALWQAQLPELDDHHLTPITTGFRFDALEIRAAARMARATAALRTNGHAMTAGDCLREACNAVARKHGERHTTFITPRRGPDDLVLAPELHARVLDLAHYFRAIPRVMDDWGFARRVSGGGVKALFTGDSGTGKTLAAEVVAAELGLPLLKVDLARVVSKWIGETEKHLDLAFNEAQDSHAVLFFDEAEALFGERGNVRHGTDRYANLEVSYLLQRLEDHSGIVILATNLRDKIDPAFVRRFHSVIGFPRPGEKERRRMWQRVFTPQIPRDGDLDLAALSRLDLTGAGIVGAAQTAAFLAAREDAPLAMRHVVGGLVRQFQRESRVLTAHDLGAYAIHMERTQP